MRNETAHIYDEIRADTIGKRIGSYVALFMSLEEKWVQYQ
jgi:hypothetical protein